KDPVAATMNPTTRGVTIPARFAHRLKSPPVSPSKDFGATSVINVQPRLHRPWPKKATDRTAITSASLLRKLTVTITEANPRPATIGSLRARLAEPLFRSSQSEKMPPLTTPHVAAMNGKTA